MLALIMGLALCLLWDMLLGYIDGIILLSGFTLTLFGMSYLAISSSTNGSPRQKYSQPKMTTIQAIANSILGLTVLILGSKSLVWGAVGIATLLGVGDLIIGLTIVAIGTSLPELAASVISSLKNKHDIAIGNILGSNIFNILGVLAIPGLICPSVLDLAIIKRDYPFMVALLVMLYLFSRMGNKGYIGRLAGLSLLFVYISYNGLIFYQSTI